MTATTVRNVPETMITFLYRNHRGEVAMRRAWPITIMFGMSHWHPEPQWLLEGLDTDKNEVRHYALKDCQFNVPPWVHYTEEAPNPTEPGLYLIRQAGDSESIDGHVIYDYPDYEEFAEWAPAKPEEFEDFEGGYKGQWGNVMTGETEGVIAWCGPIHLPPYKARA